MSVDVEHSGMGLIAGESRLVEKARQARPRFESAVHQRSSGGDETATHNAVSMHSNFTYQQPSLVDNVIEPAVKISLTQLVDSEEVSVRGLENIRSRRQSFRSASRLAMTNPNSALMSPKSSKRQALNMKSRNALIKAQHK